MDKQVATDLADALQDCLDWIVDPAQFTDANLAEFIDNAWVALNAYRKEVKA
jgi:hypothetical protein